jgi:hypothetical protein
MRCGWMFEDRRQWRLSRLALAALFPRQLFLI